MREKRKFRERPRSLGGFRCGSNGCFMHLAALLLLTVKVYSDEQSCSMRKRVNCQDALSGENRLSFAAKDVRPVVSR